MVPYRLYSISMQNKSRSVTGYVKSHRPTLDIIVVEAWPKLQELRAQYKLVQIALNEKTYQPHALLMYAPNFHPKTAPKWDHYEFRDIKRNAIGAGFAKFVGNFIPEKPPANWKIHRHQFGQQPAQQQGQQQEQPVQQQAQNPAGTEEARFAQPLPAAAVNQGIMVIPETVLMKPDG